MKAKKHYRPFGGGCFTILRGHRFETNRYRDTKLGYCEFHRDECDRDLCLNCSEYFCSEALNEEDANEDEDEDYIAMDYCIYSEKSPVEAAQVAIAWLQ